MTDYGNRRCGRTVGQGSTCDLTAGHGGACTEDWGPSMTPAANAAVRARGGRGSGDPPGLKRAEAAESSLRAWTVEELVAVGTMKAKIDRVLALHKLNPLSTSPPDGYFNHDPICEECAEDYPCRTVRILKGEE